MANLEKDQSSGRLVRAQLDDTRASTAANERRATATLTTIEKQTTAIENQLAVMREAGAHTEGLAQQAVRQTDLTQAQMILSNRPWISVDVAVSSPLVFDARGCSIMLQITTRNVGHSVAKHISLWVDFAVTGVHTPNQVLDRLSEVMKLPENETSDYGSLLFPERMRAEQLPVVARPEVLQKAIEADPFTGTGLVGLHS